MVGWNNLILATDETKNVNLQIIYNTLSGKIKIKRKVLILVFLKKKDSGVLIVISKWLTGEKTLRQLECVAVILI